MKEIFASLTSYYMNEYTVPNKLNITIEIVENVNESCSDYMKKIDRDYSISDFENNGCICVPNFTSEPTTIYISKNLVESCHANYNQYYCTFFHELTHAIDYYNYCNKYCDGNYDDFMSKQNVYGFTMWSEFHAKSVSYYLYCKILNPEKYNTVDAKNMILTRELPFQNNYLSDEIFKYDFRSAVYHIIQYIGRYYIWEKLFSSEFANGNHFPKIIIENFKREVLDLYDLFINYKDNEEYYLCVHKTINKLIGKIVTLNFL